MSSPLAYPQTVTLHFKHLSSTKVSKYVVDEDQNKYTITFQVQSDKTRAYREYTSIVNPNPALLLLGATGIVQTAYEDVWTRYHADMLAFVSAEAVKPGSNEMFAVPTYV